MGKINRILSGNGFAIAVAFIHLLIVLRACQYCISGRDQDWPMVWVAFLFIDGPVFILSTIFPPYPRMNFFPGGPNAPLNDLNNFWIPALI